MIVHKTVSHTSKQIETCKITRVTVALDNSIIHNDKITHIMEIAHIRRYYMSVVGDCNST